MIHPLTEDTIGRRNANGVKIRIAALDAASRVHQRVSSPSGGMFTTTAYERYLRTGEIGS